MTKTFSLTDVRGTSALVIDAVKGVTDLVEEMHRNIASVSPVLGVAPQGRTRGITGLVYRSVRGVTDVVGWGIAQSLRVAGQPAVSQYLQPLMEPVLGRLAKQLNLKSATPYRETVLAAANGVLGDHLAATGNPLAIRMQLRHQGQAVELGKLPAAGRKLLVMVHGLCMNDLQWLRDGHDHGASLAQSLGYTPLYLHYNTGRPIADNGADFSARLEQLVAQWPGALQEIVIVGHSMGGLVTRSACHHAMQDKQAWVKRLHKVICLGTPHAGAPLERAGRWVDYLLGISPYTAPFARLGLVRSAGIQDLRDGRIAPAGQTLLWPPKTKLYAMAATRQKAPAAKRVSQGPARLAGDGLVPVKSAWGQAPALSAPFPLPLKQQALVYETDHFALLSSEPVHRQMLRWLQAT